MKKARGLFISIEGIDGAGKTTVRNKVVEWFKESQIPFCQTREPGGTPNAERLREFVLFDSTVSPHGGHNEQEGLTPMTQALIVNAARLQHVEVVIKPNLAEGKVVITDRFCDSTLAYQGAIMGVDVGALQGIHKLALGNFYPDLTILLDLEPEIAKARIDARAGGKNLLDRLTIEDYSRARLSFLQSVSASDREAIVVDASQNEEQVFAQILPTLMQIKNKLRERLHPFDQNFKMPLIKNTGIKDTSV